MSRHAPQHDPAGYSFTYDDKLRAVRHEITMRKQVYQRWVDQGRDGWTQERCDRAIAVMVAIEQDYIAAGPQGALAL